MGQAAMKKQIGSRWEITIDGKPRMITASNWRSKAQYLKLKSPRADVTVRDLEGAEETIVVPPQLPRVRQ